MFRSIKPCLLASLMLLLAFTFVNEATVRAEEESLLDYEVALVSNYVFRGVDVFREVFAKEGEKDEAFNFSPALQPSVTFAGPGGFSFNIWGSFALTDRDDEADKNFGGLEELDELDYSLLWDWENKLGSFTIGLVNFSAVRDKVGGGITEVFISWALPFWEAIAPSITHNTDINTAATYTALSFGGGDTLSWNLSLGNTSKLQDITGGVGYAFGDFGVSFNGSFRPNPEILGGPYDEDGNYVVAGTGQTESYPNTVFWITLTYGGGVTK